MTDRELMQMALDALMMCNSETMYASQRAAMNRLRDRLAQEAALDKMVAENERLGLYDNQKPVAWMCKNKHGNTVFFTDQQSLKSADLVDWEVIPLVRQP